MGIYWYIPQFLVVSPSLNLWHSLPLSPSLLVWSSCPPCLLSAHLCFFITWISWSHAAARGGLLRSARCRYLLESSSSRSGREDYLLEEEVNTPADFVESLKTRGRKSWSRNDAVFGCSRLMRPSERVTSRLIGRALWRVTQVKTSDCRLEAGPVFTSQKSEHRHNTNADEHFDCEENKTCFINWVWRRKTNRPDDIL